jgi:hypothetical protein
MDRQAGKAGQDQEQELESALKFEQDRQEEEK